MLVIEVKFEIHWEVARVGIVKIVGFLLRSLLLLADGCFWRLCPVLLSAGFIPHEGCGQMGPGLVSAAPARPPEPRRRAPRTATCVTATGLGFFIACVWVRVRPA